MFREATWTGRPVRPLHLTASRPPIRVQLLGNGPMRIWVHDVEITTGLRDSARQLLAWFLLHPEGRTIDTAVTALWPDTPPERVSQRFWTALGSLRSRLDRRLRRHQTPWCWPRPPAPTSPNPVSSTSICGRFRQRCNAPPTHPTTPPNSPRSGSPSRPIRVRSPSTPTTCGLTHPRRTPPPRAGRSCRLRRTRRRPRGARSSHRHP